jgi:hypothetical protein
MKTYAEAERENARRFNKAMADDLYGLGYLNDPPPPREDVPEANYKIEWPVGYWEEYERLRRDALALSGALVVHMVMGINGRFQVYALMPETNKVAQVAGPLRGPEAHDRLLAWQAFNETFRPKTIHVPANKNNDVMVAADGTRVEESLKTLAGYVPPQEPKKGRKGRK